MTGAQGPLRLFNAFNGKELALSIIEAHKDELAGDSNFNMSITYPVVEFETVTTIRAYPREPAEFKVESKKKFEVEQFIPKDGETPVVMVVSSSRRIEVPDKEREDMGIPVPTPTNKAGVIVDEPVIRKPRG